MKTSISKALTNLLPWSIWCADTFYTGLYEPPEEPSIHVCTALLGRNGSFTDSFWEAHPHTAHPAVFHVQLITLSKQVFNHPFLSASCGHFTSFALHGLSHGLLKLPVALWKHLSYYTWELEIIKSYKHYYIKNAPENAKTSLCVKILSPNLWFFVLYSQI